MKELTEKQKKILITSSNIEKHGSLAIAKEFSDIDDKITQFSEDIKEELKKKLDEELSYEVDEQKIVDSVLAKVEIPEPIKGEDGKDYILTEKDREDIAKSIEVPVVEKIIEKTEVIREQPIVTNEVIEVAKYETPDEITDKVNLGKPLIKKERVEGLTDFQKQIRGALLYTGISEKRAIELIGIYGGTSGGSGTPGGTNGQIQYNNGGTFGGYTGKLIVSPTSNSYFIQGIPNPSMTGTGNVVYGNIGGSLTSGVGNFLGGVSVFNNATIDASNLAIGTLIGDTATAGAFSGNQLLGLSIFQGASSVLQTIAIGSGIMNFSGNSSSFDIFMGSGIGSNAQTYGGTSNGIFGSGSFMTSTVNGGFPSGVFIFGSSSGVRIENATNCVIVGTASGQIFTDSDSLLILGNNTANLYTGSSSVAIGNNVEFGDATANNQLVISNFMYGIGMDGTGTTISAGLLGLGVKTATAVLHLDASSTARASLRIPSGTAPTSPNHGDIWTTATHLYARLSGVTYQLDQQGGGAGDMILASVQTNSGVKTFLDGTMKLRNVANTFDGVFTNTNTANRTYTLKDASGTLAFTSDITGTNSGTNTGDQTITLTGGVTGSGTGSFAATVVTNANLTGVITSVGNATSIASQTGTGTKFVVDTAPTLVTSVTVPKIIGGTSTTQSLTFQTTTGVGTTNADFIWLAGNNGATEVLRITNAGAMSTSFNITCNNLLASTLVRAGATSAFSINGRSQIKSSADGTMESFKADGTTYSQFLSGNHKLPTVGDGFYVKEGTNATMGRAVLVAGTVVVNTTKVTATSEIFLTNNVNGGTLGSVSVSARTAGTSFTITSTNVLDTSTISWIIIEPA